MEKSHALILAAIVIGIFGILHLLRSILQTPVTVGDARIPLSVSYGAVVFAGWLSWELYKASKSKSRH